MILSIFFKDSSSFDKVGREGCLLMWGDNQQEAFVTLG